MAAHRLAHKMSMGFLTKRRSKKMFVGTVKSGNFGVFFAKIFFCLKMNMNTHHFDPLWCCLKSGPRCWQCPFWILPTPRPLFFNFLRRRNYNRGGQFRQYYILFIMNADSREPLLISSCKIIFKTNRSPYKHFDTFCRSVAHFFFFGWVVLEPPLNCCKLFM